MLWQQYKDKIMEELDISTLETFSDDIADEAPMPYVSFSGKTGEWKYGFDNDDLGTDVQISVGARTLAVGYIGWKSGDVVYEKMVSIFDKKNQVVEKDLPPIKKESEMDGYSKQTSVAFIIDGEAYEFKGSSVGADKWFKKLTTRIVKQFALNKEFCNPVITVDETNYMHKKFKSLIYSPEFKIIGWCNDNGERLVEKSALPE